jgi:hypothetical protein
MGGAMRNPKQFAIIRFSRKKEKRPLFVFSGGEDILEDVLRTQPPHSTQHRMKQHGRSAG